MFLRTFALTVVLLVIAGCNTTVDPGGVRIDGPSLNIGDHNSHSGSGRFCPPGQAKKGNC